MKFGQLHLFENPMGRTEREIVRLACGAPKQRAG